MGRKIAISDIHGCPKTFVALLDSIGLDHSDELFLLGDYVDRGPDSKGVIDTIWQLQKDDYSLRCLAGNHEQMLLHAVLAEQRQAAHSPVPTDLLQSFGIGRISDIPPDYLNWLSDLELYIEIPGYLLVHAGLNFHQSNPLADTESMLWIRDWQSSIDRSWLGRRVIVHGHTPQPVDHILARLASLDRVPALCIDAGCAIGQAPYGQLCAFDLTNGRLYFQENVDTTGN